MSGMEALWSRSSSSKGNKHEKQPAVVQHVKLMLCSQEEDRPVQLMLCSQEDGHVQTVAMLKPRQRPHQDAQQKS